MVRWFCSSCEGLHANGVKGCMHSFGNQETVGSIDGLRCICDAVTAVMLCTYLVCVTGTGASSTRLAVFCCCCISIEGVASAAPCGMVITAGLGA